MPKRSSARELKWAVLLWAFLGGCIWTGCGNDDPIYEVKLENGYTLTEWSWGDVIITDPKGDSIGESMYTIHRMAVYRNYVYGNYIFDDQPVGAVQEYFIVDTVTMEYRWFIEHAQWELALDQIGADPSAMTSPNDLRERMPARVKVLLLGVAFCILAGLLFSATRCLIGFEAELRQRKLDRL
jgi:hypothetical protein